MWTAVVLPLGVLFVAWVVLRKKVILKEGSSQTEQAAEKRLWELTRLNESSNQREVAATDVGPTLLNCAELIDS